MKFKKIFSLGKKKIEINLSNLVYKKKKSFYFWFSTKKKFIQN